MGDPMNETDSFLRRAKSTPGGLSAGGSASSSLRVLEKDRERSPSSGGRLLKAFTGGLGQSFLSSGSQSSTRRLHGSSSDVTKLHASDSYMRRGSMVNDFFYPMWIVPMDTFLSLKRFRAHQDMLREGQLVKYEPHLHEGSVIFVSHQWVGFNHPDPHDELFECLRQTLQRIIAGKGRAKFMEDSIERWGSRGRNAGRGDKRKRHRLLGGKKDLSDMFIWFDFMCCPQPAWEIAASTSSRTKSARVTATDDNNAPSFLITDHRFARLRGATICASEDNCGGNGDDAGSDDDQTEAKAPSQEAKGAVALPGTPDSITGSDISVPAESPAVLPAGSSRSHVGSPTASPSVQSRKASKIMKRLSQGQQPHSTSPSPTSFSTTFFARKSDSKKGQEKSGSVVATATKTFFAENNKKGSKSPSSHPRRMRGASAIADPALRDRVAELSKGLKEAVRSLPAYVEASSLMIVLAPTVQHRHIPQAMCDLRSWRNRGWCRLELAAAYLSRRNIETLQILTPWKHPKFTGHSDVFTLVPVQGQFACCTRNHVDPRGEIIACDKYECQRIIGRMIKAKVKFLSRAGRLDAMRFTMIMKNHFLGISTVGRQLDAKGDEGSVFAASSLDSFKRNLLWTVEDDVRGREVTGMTLVFWASMANNERVLSLALRDSPNPAVEVNQACAPHGDSDIFIPGGSTPLMVAVISSALQCVKVLLKAGADPTTQDDGGRGAFDYISAGGRTPVAAAWKTKFPDCFTSIRGDRGDRWTCLAPIIACRSSHLLDLTRMSLDAGTPSGFRLSAGGFVFTPLHCLAQNDRSDDSIFGFLQEFPLFVEFLNEPVRVGSRRLALYKRVCRATRRLKIHLPSSTRLMRLVGSTPCHFAAARGNASVLKMFLNHGADVTIRNSAGQTALDMAEMTFHGHPPPVIAAMLNAAMGMNSD